MDTLSHWIRPSPIDIPTDIQNIAGNDRLIGEALLRRKITTGEEAKAFLYPQFYTPADASQLNDLDKAVERIQLALNKRQKIGIWGDFDVDGQTSTTLLVSALKNLGANVDFHIPIRATESHGINLTGLYTFLSKGIDLVISCDTGVTAFDAAEACRSKQVDLIITDHHTLSGTLPDAYAVVNPQRLPQGHALSYLCGVGCAYKVIEKLYQNLGKETETNQFLDLVALGTIADIALLKADNRFLVQKGIETLQNSPRSGLKAIYKLTETHYERLSEEHISFILAPRMNALGRLSDANPMVSFLMSTNSAEVENFALGLEKWNDERKLLCDQVFKAAQRQIELDHSLLQDPILILSHPEWPTGVVGIVASRLVELYHRPCILLATPAGQPARGSARSVEGINITEAISSQSRLLLGFGGHPMAAGLALEANQISQFRRSIAKYVEKLDKPSEPSAAVRIDAEVPLQDISLNLVEKISALAPFGAGNPSFVLAANNLTIRNKTAIGKNNEHLKLIVEDSSGTSAEVIWWQGTGFPLPEGRFNLAYSVRSSDFRGGNHVQVEWVDAQSAAQEIVNLVPPTPDIEIIDYRKVNLTPPQLESLLIDTPAIWVEGKKPSDSKVYADRFQIAPNPVLIIWNPPPGIYELKQVLNNVQPQKVILLGNENNLDQLNQFGEYLIGLVKYGLNHKEGWLDLDLFAARMGHQSITIQKGIAWLCAKGFIKKINQKSTTEIQIDKNGESQETAGEVENELTILLNETHAYRQFYLRASPDVIISAAQRFEIKK